MSLSLSFLSSACWSMLSSTLSIVSKAPHVTSSHVHLSLRSLSPRIPDTPTPIPCNHCLSSKLASSLMTVYHLSFAFSLFVRKAIDHAFTFHRVTGPIAMCVGMKHREIARGLPSLLSLASFFLSFFLGVNQRGFGVRWGYVGRPFERQPKKRSMMIGFTMFFFVLFRWIVGVV